MKVLSKTNIPGDISGGISSAVVSLPGNMVYGIIALAPLGSEYIALGIMAGFYCSVFVGLLAAFFGGTPGMISGPRAPAALILSSVIAHLLVSPHLGMDQTTLIPSVLALTFLVVLFAGIFQTTFGMLRFGSLIKFLPYPVIAGFLNGTAILIIIGQTWNFLGIPNKESLVDLWSSFSEIQPLTVLIGTVTALTMWKSSRIIKNVPGSIVGIVAGCILYHMMLTMGFRDNLGPTIGTVPVMIPSPRYVKSFWDLLVNLKLLELLPHLLPAAFSIAVLNCTDSLLTSLNMQSLTNKRSDTNRDLVGLGIGNMVAACFGGIAGAGSMVRSLANYNAGGRTQLSGTINSITTLLIIYMLFPLMGLIPKAVIAGVLLVLAFQIADSWIIKLFKDIFFRRVTHRKDLMGNFFIILLVMLVAAFFNLVVAVGLGIAVSILLFVAKMSKSGIRRIYHGSSVRSKKQRDEKFMELISKHGHRVIVLELEGSIFFGSADNLAHEIERLSAQGVSFIILDMKRVNEIDSTGVHILELTFLRLEKQNKFLAISYLEKGGSLSAFLKEMSLYHTMGEKYFFQDTDLALEYFEDCLLRELLTEEEFEDVTVLERLTALRGLSKEELKILSRFLNLEHFEKHDIVIRQGDKGDALFFIIKGSADVTIDLPGTARKKRLQTFSSGTFFGEMAFLDGRPRSANVEAREPLDCYRLKLDNFEKLKKEHPHISTVLMTNISRTLSRRLRFANEMISELEM